MIQRSIVQETGLIFHPSSILVNCVLMTTLISLALSARETLFLMRSSMVYHIIMKQFHVVECFNDAHRSFFLIRAPSNGYENESTMKATSIFSTPKNIASDSHHLSKFDPIWVLANNSCSNKHYKNIVI